MQVTELFSKGVDFTFFRITSDTDMLINIFHDASKSYDINFTVLDIENQNKHECFERHLENKRIFSQSVEKTISNSIEY